jgi:hypothetical protein
MEYVILGLLMIRNLTQYDVKRRSTPFIVLEDVIS